MKDDAALRKIANEIADRLGEQKPAPRYQIWRVVRRFGAAQCYAWLSVALERARNGSELTTTGMPRTAGGFFFKQSTRAMLQQRRARRTRKAQRPQPPASFVWELRHSTMQQLYDEKGVIDEVKVTLIGRPGRVALFRQCVLTTMQPPRGPTLPRGLPVAPATERPYVVYISRRHWAAVAEQIQQPDQVLVIDGWISPDQELATIIVYALQVRSEAKQAARRQQGASDE